MAKLKITHERNDPAGIRRIEAKDCHSLTVTHLNGRRAVLDLDGEQFLIRATNPKAYGLLLFHDTEERLNHVDEIVLEGQHDLTIRRTGPGVFEIEHTYGAPLQPSQEPSPQLDSPYSFAQGTRKDHEGTIILQRRKPPKRRRPPTTQNWSNEADPTRSNALPTDNKPFHTLSITTSDVLENQQPNPESADEDDNADFEAARRFLKSLGPEAQEDLRQELSILAMNYQFFDDTCAAAYPHILNRARTQS